MKLNSTTRARDTHSTHSTRDDDGDAHHDDDDGDDDDNLKSERSGDIRWNETVEHAQVF